MSLFSLWVCSFQIYSGLMKLDVINNTAYKGLEMVIFKLLFLSYMPTTPYMFLVYHANSIAILYIVHKYQKKFESTNMDLTPGGGVLSFFLATLARPQHLLLIPKNT